MDFIITQTLAMMVVAIFVAIIARRLALPYTVGLVLAGIALALSRHDTGIRLTHDIIFNLILPPLLFEAAINIPWHELRRDMAPILALSVAGVVISAGLVSCGMVWLLGWPMEAAVIFGVLIAATDPVAVIAMFKDIGIQGRLRLLVESESLFNDGVAAVLFGLALSWAGGESGSLLSGSRALLTVSGGGIAVGLAVGGGALLLAARTADHLVEAAVTCVASYTAFIGAEYFHFSGVLATVSAGLLMGGVGVRGTAPALGLSKHGREFVIEFWEFLAFIANSFVFLLIGASLAQFSFRQVGVVTLSIAIVLVLLGRAATIYPLCAIFRNTSLTIGKAEQHVLWWGGLRGALALALALALPSSLPHREAVTIVTFGVVAFSVVVQGLTMPMLLRKLNLLPKTPA